MGRFQTRIQTLVLAEFTRTHCAILTKESKMSKIIWINPLANFSIFDRELFLLLPREIVEFIEKPAQKRTFSNHVREFVTESGNGLRLKDKISLNDDTNDHILARVGAARISKWLERLVLPEQDILVDAPHLVLRYPNLITSDKKRKKIETWKQNSTINRTRQIGA